MKKKWLIVIAGPTAVGKTALAIQVAKQLQSEIFSADSRQFYKEMTIGTAVPSAIELAAIPHHFIHHISILQDDYSAGKYEAACILSLQQYFEQKDVAIMVGGSGLFIKAVCDGFDTIEKKDADNSFRDFLNQQSIEWLQNELERIDPAYYTIVDKKNPVRLKRALEVIHHSGKKYSEQRSGIKKERPFNILKIALNIERPQLYERINQRVDAMIAMGLEAEARSLYQQKQLNALQTVGYKEFFDYFDKKNTKDEAIALIKQNSRNYAKRQLTWLKKETDLHWFAPNDFEKIIAYIRHTMSNQN